MKSIFCFLLFTISCFIEAQPPSKFYTRIGGNGYDVGYDVKQTLDNGYIITGSTSSMGVGNTDMYLLKLDSMGQIKFQTTFGNANNDIGKSVIQLIDSSYIMVGYTNSIGFGGYDVFLVKADKNGALVWQKTIGGTDWDFANSLQQTSDGGFIIAGSTYSYGYGNEDGYVVKTDANGNITWSKTFGGANDDEFKSVIQTMDGGYALCGSTKSYGDINGDAWVFKLLANGDSAYSYKYNFGLYDTYNDIKEIVTGEFILGGARTYTNTQQRESIFVRINTSGQILTQFEDGQIGSNEEYFKVDVSNSSFGAYTALGNSHENGPAFKEQVKMILFNNGGYVNGGALGGNEDDECTSFSLVKKESSKGYIAVGFTYSYNSILSDVLVFKYDSLLSYGTNITGLANESDLLKINRFYPSPFQTIVNLDIDNKSIIKIEVFSIDGNIVYEQESKLQKNKLDLSFLNDGIYILSITDKKGYKVSQKIIKNSF